MADIEVEQAGPGEYEVSVREGGSSTAHRVAGVDADHRAALGLPGADEVDDAGLLEESFRFLLEREPKESILASFELPVIARYFPEYPDEMRRRFGEA